MRRRHFLNWILLSQAWLALIPLSANPQGPQIVEHISIYEKHDAYCAWPAVARAANGDIVILFTRSEEHMGPNGEILLVRSTDNGKTWRPPVIIYDTVIDDRESGLTKLENGDLLAHFRSVKFTPGTYENLPASAYEEHVLEKWIEYVGRNSYQNADHLSRSWHALSTDNGLTWSKPSPGRDSIHGGLQLQDGTLMVASYRDNKGNIGVYTSQTPLGEWSLSATIRCPKPESIRFGEPHILQLPGGRIVMMMRATAIPYDDGADRCRLWGSYSDDNGLTWSEPYETPLWGYPPHLTQLSDGRILCTYGYRRPPFGQRACISDDGITWELENEIILRDDAANKDLGYPVSLELEPGRILSIYYQPDLPPGANPETHPPSPSRRKPGILGTVWKLPQD
jgi:hypothetical protein